MAETGTSIPCFSSSRMSRSPFGTYQRLTVSRMIDPHLVCTNHFYASDTLMYLRHSHHGELRLIARLTAVYHNSIVNINTQTKDLNGQIHWHADEDVVAPPELLTLE